MKKVPKLLCAKCRRELPQPFFFGKWWREAEDRGMETAVCLDCEERMGLYACKSRRNRLEPREFTLARPEDWANEKRRGVRRVLSERCIACQMKELEATGAKGRTGKAKLKELKQGCFDAVLRGAKRRGMSYGQYRAFLYRRELAEREQKGVGC